MNGPKSDVLIAVTGSTGLVGASLVSHLLKRGYTVRAVGRSESGLKELQAKSFNDPAGANLSTAVADVSDQTALQAAFAGANCVVHAAGCVDAFGSRDAIFATNVGGTKNALQAAIAAKVKHFIQISSLSVITGGEDQFDLDESAPLKKIGEPYADSKVEAETVAMNEKNNSAIKVSALRPGFIYGPGERSWMPRLINSIGTGKAMLIDGGKRQTNVIYVENLNKAIEKAILNEAAYGQVYNLTDGENISKKKLFDAIADGLGLPRVTKVVPRPLARMVCEVVSRAAPFLPPDAQRQLARYSRAAFRLAAVNQGFSVRKAERDLDYTDRIPFEVGMNETLIGFKQKPGEGASADARGLSGVR